MNSEKTGEPLIFFGITDSDKSYSKVDFDGIIGLGVKEESTCTMDQLKFMKFIKDKSFSIFINSDKAKMGHIKFGGFDKKAVLPGREL